jgi:ribosomal protein S27AE
MTVIKNNPNTCPRCGAALDTPLGRPALSRLDNRTRVCSSCGTAEAMWDHEHRGDDQPMPGFDTPLYP